ncbi:MAG: hypothetical protein JRI80_15985 [Deltaproteobacteria bacterium]|nr:hypothetical protein [Deltaproteobacteria bacterium]
MAKALTGGAVAGMPHTGAMIKDSALTDLQGVTACVSGNLLMLPIFTIGYSFAKYTSIFGFSPGCNIMLVSTCLGLFSRGVFLSCF